GQAPMRAPARYVDRADDAPRARARQSPWRSGPPARPALPASFQRPAGAGAASSRTSSPRVPPSSISRSWLPGWPTWERLLHTPFPSQSVDLVWVLCRCAPAALKRTIELVGKDVRLALLSTSREPG